MHNRYEKVFPATIGFSVLLMALGLCFDTPAEILHGLHRIITAQDLLITDYMALGGVGAALANSGLVCLFSLAILVSIIRQVYTDRQAKKAAKAHE